MKNYKRNDSESKLKMKTSVQDDEEEDSEEDQSARVASKSEVISRKGKKKKATKNSGQIKENCAAEIEDSDESLTLNFDSKLLKSRAKKKKRVISENTVKKLENFLFSAEALKPTGSDDLPSGEEKRKPKRAERWSASSSSVNKPPQKSKNFKKRSRLEEFSRLLLGDDFVHEEKSRNYSKSASSQDEGTFAESRQKVFSQTLPADSEMQRKTSTAKDSVACTSEEEDEATPDETRSYKAHYVHEDQEDSAWHDPDDENIQVDIIGNRKLRKLRETAEDEVLTAVEYRRRLQKLRAKIYLPTQDYASEPYWIRNALQINRNRVLNVSDSKDHLLSSDSDNLTSEENDILKSSKPLLKNNKNELLQNKIKIKRLPNVNQGSYHRGLIHSLDFHPNRLLLLTAGCDKNLKLFKVCDKKSRLVQSMFLKRFCVLQSKFNEDGNCIFMLGRMKSIIIFDLISGKLDVIPSISQRSDFRMYHKICFNKVDASHPNDGSRRSLFALAAQQGYVLVCDSHSKSVVRSFKMNAGVSGMAFHPFKDRIITTDTEGHIYEWDLKEGKCIRSFLDESSLKITHAEFSKKHPFVFATGSSCGFTSIFSLLSSGDIEANPIKTLGNLTTSISNISFDDSGQLMCFSSSYESNAIRLLHLPSITVYSNWPSKNDTFRCVNRTAFSHFSGKLAVANDGGRVLLFDIKNLR